MTVFVEGLEFYGFHGAVEAEQAVGHRYVADISVEFEAKEAESDDIAKTVDYTGLAAIMLKINHDKRFRTVEAFAAAYCEEVFKAAPLVSEVTVKIAKRLPPVPMIAATVGVILTRKRAAKGRERLPEEIV